MPDRYYRDADPRDDEWWNHPTHLERRCAQCGVLFHVDESHLNLPHVFCPRCIEYAVADAVHRHFR